MASNVYKSVWIDRDFCMIATWAVRYCLGRRTYCVGAICEYLTPLVGNFDDNTLCVMRQDIVRQEEFGYGDECDKRTWENFLEVITKTMKRRGLEIF